MLQSSNVREILRLHNSCRDAALLRPSLPGRVHGHNLVFPSLARNVSRASASLLSSLRHPSLFFVNAAIAKQLRDIALGPRGLITSGRRIAHLRMRRAHEFSRDAARRSAS